MTAQLFNQHFLETYLSKCYHQQPHKPTHVRTSKAPASFQSDNCVIPIAPHFSKKGHHHFQLRKDSCTQCNKEHIRWFMVFHNSMFPPEPPLTATITHQANFILFLDKTKSELANYLDASANFPTESTFIQTINNRNFITSPGLTSKLISKHLPISLPTLKVHLSQEHQNIRASDPQKNCFNKIETQSRRTTYPGVLKTVFKHLH